MNKVMCFLIGFLILFGWVGHDYNNAWGEDVCGDVSLMQDDLERLKGKNSTYETNGYYDSLSAAKTAHRNDLNANAGPAISVGLLPPKTGPPRFWQTPFPIFPSDL